MALHHLKNNQRETTKSQSNTGQMLGRMDPLSQLTAYYVTLCVMASQAIDRRYCPLCSCTWIEPDTRIYIFDPACQQSRVRRIKANMQKIQENISLRKA